MIIIRPHHEFIDCPSSDDILRRIELAGRTCYKSEDRIAPGSAEDFVRGIIKRGHLSVIEHVNITVRIVCDRAISHELVRHRLASYCLAGDTEVVAYRHPSASARHQKKWTLAKLFEWQNDPQRKGRLKLIRLRSVDAAGCIVAGAIKKIMFSGEQTTFEVVTKSGRRIRATTKHRFMTERGWEPLGHIGVGSRLVANGGRVGMHSEVGIERLRESKQGSKNPQWRGDQARPSAGYLRAQQLFAFGSCWGCSEKSGIERHHIDKNPLNNDPSNVMPLCQKCHKSFHLGPGVLKVFYDEIVSIREYGVEPTYDVEMMQDPHNFVANGLVVHNSQESSRYANYAKEKFGRQITVILPLWYEDIIPTGIHTTEELAILENQLYDSARPEAKRAALWLAAVTQAETSYLWMVKNGAAPQEARSVLPNSLKTEVIMTANLRELKHIFKVRCAPAAHPQMREIMRPMLADFYHRVPWVFEEEYREFIGERS